MKEIANLLRAELNEAINANATASHERDMARGATLVGKTTIATQRQRQAKQAEQRLETSIDALETLVSQLEAIARNMPGGPGLVGEGQVGDVADTVAVTPGRSAEGDIAARYGVLPEVVMDDVEIVARPGGLPHRHIELWRDGEVIAQGEIWSVIPSEPEAS